MEMKLLKRMCFATLVHLALVGAISALEIYRIGGEGEPKPVESNEVRFHQLHWSAFTEKTGLEEEALAAGILQPFFLDADENIALTTPQRGGGPHVSGNVGYYVNEKSLRLVDGGQLSTTGLKAPNLWKKMRPCGSTALPWNWVGCFK